MNCFPKNDIKTNPLLFWIILFFGIGFISNSNWIMSVWRNNDVMCLSIAAGDVGDDQSTYQNVLLSNSFMKEKERSCFTRDGRFGSCMTIRSCYPNIKLPQLRHLGPWTTAIRGTCNYFAEDEKMVKLHEFRPTQQSSGITDPNLYDNQPISEQQKSRDWKCVSTCVLGLRRLLLKTGGRRWLRRSWWRISPIVFDCVGQYPRRPGPQLQHSLAAKRTTRAGKHTQNQRMDQGIHRFKTIDPVRRRTGQTAEFRRPAHRRRNGRRQTFLARHSEVSILDFVK